MYDISFPVLSNVVTRAVFQISDDYYDLPDIFLLIKIMNYNHEVL